MPYFALIIMFYHVKIACYQCPCKYCANKDFIEKNLCDISITLARDFIVSHFLSQFYLIPR